MAAFGAEVFNVIEQEPARLRDVKGIGPLRATRITEGWSSQRAVREIMVFLHTHGVGTSRALRIYKTYGADAIAIISENPYRLARDIRGIGFISADKIAERVGIAKTAMIRARAGIGYALAEALDDGHCGLPEADLIAAASRLLDVPIEPDRRSACARTADRQVVRESRRASGVRPARHGRGRRERRTAGHLPRIARRRRTSDRRAACIVCCTASRRGRQSTRTARFRGWKRSSA